VTRRSTRRRKTARRLETRVGVPRVSTTELVDSRDPERARRNRVLLLTLIVVLVLATAMLLAQEMLERA
jgi:hypothetical protein